jgi:hypothetical protein
MTTGRAARTTPTRPRNSACRIPVATVGCGLAWLAVAIVTFRLIAERGRRSGTIEFAS